jgi:hypothetical protein
MTGFIPRGYLTLQQGLGRVAQSLFREGWQSTTLSEDEQAALIRQKQAVKLLRTHLSSGGVARGGALPGRWPDRQELERKAGETPETTAAKGKLKRRDSLRKGAIGPLQRALFAGEVSAHVLAAAGSMFEVPTRVWGSTHASEVFRTGTAKFARGAHPYGGSSVVEGRVLLEEAALDGWLTPSESRPTHPTNDPSAEAAPAAQPPDPYNTGLPGRPTIGHIIRAEFLRRADAGIALRILTAEARELNAWVKQNHPKGPVATAKTIENHIRELHRRYVEKK